MKAHAVYLLAVLYVVAAPAAARAGLRETMHNLSPSGRGRQQAGGQGGGAAAEGEDDLCIFCHTPHSATALRGLWNHQLEPVTYKLYESSTTEAQMQQPTGSSRLCLSCHDGVLAVGAMKRQADPSLGKLTGPSVLGTDLSDDHPISFVYDQALVTRRHDLANPGTLTGGVKLDDTGQVQCTSCHDAHIGRHPDFLVMDPSYSALCVTCHRLPHWQESSHATSGVTARGTNALPGLGYPTVGQNGCSSCHRSHGAEHPQRLLAATTEEGVCMTCHDGHVAAKDLRHEFMKYSAHRIDNYAGIHDPTENPNIMPQHVECVDCHNSHEARARSIGGQLPGPLAGVSGISIGGSFLREATFEYEICLKCHGITEDRNPIVFRTDNVTNLRLQIDPQNPSFHPVADVGRNPNIPGLLVPLTPASRTPCTACHNNDAASRVGSSAARGPHGSNYRPILAAEYHLDAIPRPESYQLYALCYGCHDRNSVLSGSDGFPHSVHVATSGASCAVCHDAHGSRQSPHLINFMSRDVTGQVVVTPSSSGQLQYESLGMGTGRCFLTCHGIDHNPKNYPAPAGAMIQSPMKRNLRR